MICPACKNTLVSTQVKEIAVDVCKNGCAGIWFDNFELKKLDEPSESVGKALLDIKPKKKMKLDAEAKRPCPKCTGIIMMKHFFSVKKQVEIDECGSCGGVWLDAGELREIRELFSSEADRQKAADEVFGEVFGKKIASQQKKSEANLESKQKFAQALRFICPSNYLSGKQDWGAF